MVSFSPEPVSIDLELPTDVARRGVAIADEAMTAQLESCAVLISELNNVAVYGLVNASGRVVSHLSDADPGIRFAFAWLKLRGFAQIRSVGSQEQIVLHSHSVFH